MVKVLTCCDCCGREVSANEYRAQAIYGENPLKEWQLKNMVLCSGCAGMIDYALLKLKMECLRG